MGAREFSLEDAAVMKPILIAGLVTFASAGVGVSQARQPTPQQQLASGGTYVPQQPVVNSQASANLRGTGIGKADWAMLNPQPLPPESPPSSLYRRLR
jgi:hypothetical protein